MFFLICLSHPLLKLLLWQTIQNHLTWFQNFRYQCQEQNAKIRILITFPEYPHCICLPINQLIKFPFLWQPIRSRSNYYSLFKYLAVLTLILLFFYGYNKLFGMNVFFFSFLLLHILDFIMIRRHKMSILFIVLYTCTCTIQR